MKLERIVRKRKLAVSVVSWTGFFWVTILVILSFSSFLISVKKFSSSLHLLSRHHDGLDHQKLVAAWPNLVMEAISEPFTGSTTTTGDPTVTILHAVQFPDQISFFLNYPPSVPLLKSNHIDCIYLSNSSRLSLRPIHLHSTGPASQVVRCPPLPPDSTSATLRLGVLVPPPRPTYRWDSLSYEAFLDQNDNTTVVFAKGFNLLRGRLYSPNRFSCIFSQDDDGGLFHRSQVLSIGQEIVRCKTPLAVLHDLSLSKSIHQHPVKVSVRLNGRATLPSIATPVQLHRRIPTDTDDYDEMCVCTMVRNQARFLKEWITYHSQMGVSRWFIYDNNSDDDTPDVVSSLNSAGHNITVHHWPWIKSQEAGFAHCALRARSQCKWVGFIDVDEFFHFPSSSSSHSNQTQSSHSHQMPTSLHTLLHNYNNNNSNNNNNSSSKSPVIGEIRTFCYSFGPSGLRSIPTQGVTIGYTCRMRAYERHKSIIRPEALSSDLLNVVHHFRLRDGYKSVTLDRPVMVINHYKYQVWEIFKHKFYRRVATYVSDWTDEVNTGSKDRAPGLGTKPVEPEDWPTRFCQVNDTQLRDYVLNRFVDPETHVLPWEENNQ